MLYSHKIIGEGLIVMDTLILILELIGTVAFAFSGALLGVKKRMDVFGVAILGLTTAVGGGVIRDLILGATPPAAFRNPVYALLAIAVSIVVFIACRHHFNEGRHEHFDRVLLVMDSLGLGAFTVTGMASALSLGQTGAFLLVFVGVLTGVGGGVLRDVLAGETPYIFVKHVYASASLLGAFVYLLLYGVLGSAWASVVSMAATVALRILSAHFRWNLPRASGE